MTMTDAGVQDTDTPTVTADEAVADALTEAKLAFGGGLMTAAMGALELGTVKIGLDLGLYRALRLASATPTELAVRSGIHVRYAREWLEQQFTAGVVEVADRDRVVDIDPDHRRYSLPEAHAQVLLDGEGDAYFGPVAEMALSFVGAVPAVTEAFRTGGGVRFADYGPDTRHGIGHLNRAEFLSALPGWLDAVPGLRDRIAGATRPKIADVGSGTGWSTIVLGEEFPNAAIVGVDLDRDSVIEARANVAAAGRSTQIAIRRGDAAKLDAGPFALVTMFQMLHDSADPVAVLAAAKQALAVDGEILLADEATADRFGDARGELMERVQYGCSVLHCLPATMAEDPVEATGTVIRGETIRRYAAAAGLTVVEELEVAPGFFRVYRLK